MSGFSADRATLPTRLRSRVLDVSRSRGATGLSRVSVRMPMIWGPGRQAATGPGYVCHSPNNPPK